MDNRTSELLERARDWREGHLAKLTASPDSISEAQSAAYEIISVLIWRVSGLDDALAQCRDLLKLNVEAVQSAKDEIKRLKERRQRIPPTQPAN